MPFAPKDKRREGGFAMSNRNVFWSRAVRQQVRIGRGERFISWEPGDAAKLRAQTVKVFNFKYFAAGNYRELQRQPTVDTWHFASLFPHVLLL